MGLSAIARHQETSFDGQDRETLARAALKAFFGVVAEWGLSAEEARTLLGRPGRSRFYDLKRLKPSAVRSLSEDELDRLAYLVGIYADLNVLYAPESHGDWLRNPSRLEMGQPWGKGSPLEYLLSGKLKALADVYEYLNAERGGH